VVLVRVVERRRGPYNRVAHHLIACGGTWDDRRGTGARPRMNSLIRRGSGLNLSIGCVFRSTEESKSPKHGIICLLRWMDWDRGYMCIANANAPTAAALSTNSTYLKICPTPKISKTNPR